LQEETDRNGFLRLVVGSNVDYAPFVEFGTSRQAAQPYLRPAFRSVLRSRLS
jgi:HK97 gp10 family phage protein